MKFTAAADFVFDEKGLPSYKKKWDGSIPEYKGIVHKKDVSRERRPKGQLELVMDIVIKQTLVNGDEVLLSAERIADLCVAYDGFPASSSSTGLVLKRWKELGYAEIDLKRPMRFLEFTLRGMEVGLLEMLRIASRRRGETYYEWDKK